MSFAPEPTFQHGSAARTGVLLVNLGTPDAPTAPAVRRYLAEFLSDARVVELPRLLWLPILHGIILRTRPAKSAAKYASIWTPQGSPLAHWTAAQAQALQTALGASAANGLVVRHAMRYGQPSVGAGLDALKAAGCTRILIVPLYPQYSGTTTASVMDAVYDWGKTIRHLPELRSINRYHDHPGYIAALAETVRAHRARAGRQGHLLMSFHGVPARTLELGDPYHCECHKTARLLAQALGLGKDEWSLSFQSRFGKAKWLEPSTEATLNALAARGVHDLQVICPGFVGDCLETLEEIAIEGRETFLHAGGQSYDYIACLNDHPLWIDTLADLVQTHCQGWPVGLPDPAHRAELDASRERALALGARR
jgi:ferrochelatase